LEYEERPEWGEMQHPWNLGLSEEVDAAWEDLLYGEKKPLLSILVGVAALSDAVFLHLPTALNIRISEDEMSILHENRTHRVRVNRGDYVGVLGVYHHMHCLYNLRRVVHWDYYGPLLGDAKDSEGFSKAHSGKASRTSVRARQAGRLRGD
jgi:hypothetical protein